MKCFGFGTSISTAIYSNDCGRKERRLNKRNESNLVNNMSISSINAFGLAKVDLEKNGANDILVLMHDEESKSFALTLKESQESKIIPKDKIELLPYSNINNLKPEKLKEYILKTYEKLVSL